MSLSAIARMAGCSYAAVRRALLSQGIDIRRSGSAPISELRDKEWLKKRIDAGDSAGDIARALGCAEATVRTALQSAGSRPALVRWRSPALDDRSFLEDAYVRDGRSVRSIAQEVSCTKDAVLQSLRKHGIPIRKRGPVSAVAPAVPAAPAVPVHAAAGDEQDEPQSAEPDIEVATEPEPESTAAPEPTFFSVDTVLEEEPAIRDAAEFMDEVPTSRADGRHGETARGPDRSRSGMPAGSVPSARVDLEIDKLETKTFPLARRGYDRTEVDAFMRAIADDYRQVVRVAGEAVTAAQNAARQAQQQAASSTSTSVQSFDEIGGRVASVLASAAQAADEIRAAAEEEAQAIRQKAHDELGHVRQAVEDELVAAEQARVTSEEAASGVVGAARSEAAAMLAGSRDEAARILQEAAERAATLERTARANVDAVVAEARREYEHLRSVQQQCADRLASVEFLAKHARDGLSEGPGQTIDELL